MISNYNLNKTSDQQSKRQRYSDCYHITQRKSSKSSHFIDVEPLINQLIINIVTDKVTDTV